MRGESAQGRLHLSDGEGGLYLSDIGKLKEAAGVSTVETTCEPDAAHDSERAAKKFYDEFRLRRLDFLERLHGINDEHERAALASVLLNRLMFVYFLQSGGFIKGHAARADYRYLQNELRRSRARGEGRYHAEFLRTLFFEGFAKPEHARTPRAKRLVGVVPHLGCALFIKHEIEERLPRVAVPDAAFENLFRFFERYSWNPGDAPTARADEINPDVLGHVFERHINRKSFGAYYTRDEITRHLCEQTIHSLILERVNAAAAPPSGEQVSTACSRHSLAPRRFDSMSDLLSNMDAALCRFLLDKVLPDLKLLDPACGSGAFLVAALRTLVSVYAAVIGKVSAVGDAALKRRLGRLRRENTSLDYYVRRRVVTDNLFGVDIMEEATEIARLRLLLALVASARRAEQLATLPRVDSNILAGNSLIGLLRDGGAQSDECRTRREVTATPDEILLNQFRESGIRFEQTAWDVEKNREGKTFKRELTLDDIRALRPFHWASEFGEIVNGERGGFDAIITNPPWDIFKPNAKEFFTRHSPVVKKKKTDVKEFEKEKARLLRDPAVASAWGRYLSTFPHVSAYFRSSPQYANQVAVVEGRRAGTDINLYKLFLERCFRLLRRGGQCGIVVPSGLYTDLGTKRLREMLFDETEVKGLFCFENRRAVFGGVHRSYKFVVLTFRKGGRTSEFPAAFMRRDVRELKRFRAGGGALRIPVGLVRRLSPSTLSLMEFKTEADLSLAEKLLRFPPLGERVEGVWNFALTREFDMTNDSALFKKNPSPSCLPLYEGKMIHQFTHGWNDAARFWVEEAEGRKRIIGRARTDEGRTLGYQKFRLGIRSIGRTTD
ncbi:MAG: ATP-binding protein, partial [Acidobacteria bacterium]